MVSYFLKNPKWLLRHTLTILILVSIISHTRLGLGQDISPYMKNSPNWKDNLNTSPIAFGTLSSKQSAQHFFGRYLINTSASIGVWTLSVGTASLIDNGTVHASREWFEDNALPIARPSMVLASSTFSMLLYKRIKLMTFLTTTVVNSALLLGSLLGGKLLSEEADNLLQLTTTFFLVPLTSTIYHHILSSKEENGFKVGKVRFDLMMVPYVQQVDRELLPVLGVHIQW